MDPAPTTCRFRSRRSHNKSRLGCGNCKRRRVKCDEKRPICTNCSQHSIDCDFAGAAATPASSVSSPSATPPMNARRFRFKPSKYQSVPLTGENDQKSQTTSVGVQCDLSSSSSSTPINSISLDDLHLFHNFVTSAYSTVIQPVEHQNKLWQTHVPQWSFSFPSLHHLILAFSALHLAHEQPDQRAKYITQADDHFTFGVRSITAVLSELNAENCQLIYLSAVLICFVYFGRGPRPGEYLAFNEAGTSEWLILMRGVRSILATHHEKIFSGPLTPRAEETVLDISPSFGHELQQHKSHIMQILRWIGSFNIQDAEREIYTSATKTLQDIYDEVYRVRSSGKDGASLMHLVIGWIYRLPEQFVSRLEGKDPVALVVLAYWSVLLKYMQSCWFMKEWDKHVLGGIQGALPDAYLQLVEWPLYVIQT